MIPRSGTDRCSRRRYLVMAVGTVHILGVGCLGGQNTVSRTINNKIEGIELTGLTDSIETAPGGQTEVFVVKGTVRNTTDQPLEVMLEATFYASNDGQLGKATAYVPEMNTELQPNSEAPFRLSHETNTNDIARYTLTVQPPG